jgi:GntR family transcriptional regulator
MEESEDNHGGKPEGNGPRTMSIDTNSPVPVFLQIVEHIRRAVAAGVYRSGELIPSQRALALELTVNPNTVQRAYEVLEREGLVRARKGVGMLVTDEGVRAARETAEAGVHTTFARGIRAAQAAGIPVERVRAAFEKAMEESNMEQEEGS